MRDLIEALTILMKYGKDAYAPTHCEHDIFLVAGLGIEEGVVTAEDAERLKHLGFHWDSENSCWASFRFGSC